MRKGAIPSQFPWTEEIQHTHITEENNSAIVQQEHISSFETSSDVTKENNVTTSLSLDNLINILHNQQLRMPSQWTYAQYDINNLNNKRLLVFFLPICNKIHNYTDGYTITSVKEIIVQENMMLQINILKQLICNILTGIQVPNVVENIEQLQELLFSINNLRRK